MTAPSSNRIPILQMIFSKIRRLTGSNDPYQLPDVPNPGNPNSVGLSDYVNSFYLFDFPAQYRALKLKDVYTFDTIQNIDTYTFDSENYTTVQAPCFCMQREIKLFQEPESFWGANYNWQEQTNFAFGDGTAGGQTGTITGATNANPGVITSIAHGLVTGARIFISGVGGMTQLNGNTYSVTFLTINTFSINVDTTAFGAYTSGGTWLSSSYNGFTSAMPILRSVNNNPNFNVNPNYQASRVQNILITANLTEGTLNVTDDGNGNLIGDATAGQINYFTGEIVGLNFTQAIPQGNQIQIQYVPFVPSVPLSILFFQNQFTLRPVPDQGYTVTLVAYRQPSQALASTPAFAGNPELSEWWETIAVGAAKKIYEDRLDADGVALMDKMLQERYQANYTRTYAELGKQRIQTLFSDQLTNNYGSNGWGFGAGSV